MDGHQCGPEVESQRMRRITLRVVSTSTKVVWLCHGNLVRVISKWLFQQPRIACQGLHPLRKSSKWMSVLTRKESPMESTNCHRFLEQYQFLFVQSFGRSQFQISEGPMQPPVGLRDHQFRPLPASCAQALKPHSLGDLTTDMRSRGCPRTMALCTTWVRTAVKFKRQSFPKDQYLRSSEPWSWRTAVDHELSILVHV